MLCKSLLHGYLTLTLSLAPPISLDPSLKSGSIPQVCCIPPSASSAAANGMAVRSHSALSSAAPSRGASTTRQPMRSTRRPSEPLGDTQEDSRRQNCSRMDKITKRPPIMRPCMRPCMRPGDTGYIYRTALGRILPLSDTPLHGSDIYVETSRCSPIHVVLVDAHPRTCCISPFSPRLPWVVVDPSRRADAVGRQKGTCHISQGP